MDGTIRLGIALRLSLEHEISTGSVWNVRLHKGDERH